MNADALWTRLSAEGVVHGPRPDPSPDGLPWFARLMLGVAGWIGAIFLLSFLGMALVMSGADDGLAFMMAGVLSVAVAVALFRLVKRHDLTEQFALALSLAGQALIAIGISEDAGGGGAVRYLLIALVEAGLVWLVPAFLHRMLATCGAALAVALAIGAIGLHGIAGAALCAGIALVWLDPVRWTTGGRLWRPVGYGLVLASLMVEAGLMFSVGDLFGRVADAGWWDAHGPLTARVLTGAVLVWAAATLARREGVSPGDRGFPPVIGGALLVAALTVPAPGLGAALLILLLGFSAGNRVLMIAGVAALLGFASHFYYSLHATLLVKSVVLALTGMCLLGISLLLQRVAAASGTTRDA